MAEEKQSWWQTLPGILTATAGVITAVTGLFPALDQSGCFHESKNEDKKVQAPADSTVEENKTISPPAGLPSQPTTEEESAPLQKDSPLVKTPYASGEDINLLSPDNGGNIAAAGSDKSKETIDGRQDWVQLDYGIGQQAVYGFENGKTATFHSFAMLINGTSDFTIKGFDLFAGNDSPTGKFTLLGKFESQNLKLSATPYQSFPSIR